MVGSSIPVAETPPVRRRRRSPFVLLRYVCVVATVITAVSLTAVVLYILIRGVGKLTPALFTGEGGSPSIMPALVGTLWLMLLASVIALPLGVGGAVFLSEYAKRDSRLIRPIRVAVETLAGIPSIVYGLFGYLVFVVTLGWGYSLAGGGITLALMILPVILRSAEESLRAVPDSFREGAYALGTGKVRTIFKVVLPAASGGIVTAMILAIGRVVSESAVLILTVGMVVDKMPASCLSPGTSLALDIYYFAGHGYPDEASAAAVVLLVLILGLNLLAAGIGKLMRKRTGM